MKRLYLDHAASSPLRAVAQDALLEAFAATHGNPSSAHTEGRAARRLLEDARAELALHLGCRRDELHFTSGGTEANALAISAAPRGASIAAAATEHPSVLRAAEIRGRLRTLPVDPSGGVLLDEPAGAGGSARSMSAGPSRPPLAPLADIALLSVALVNHETGRIQDIPRLASLAAAAGIPMHTDATQAFGRIPFEFERLGVRLLSVSAHKIGGPHGIGALVIAEGTDLEPLLVGGGQEAGVRAGTECAALAHAFAATAAECQRFLVTRLERWHALARLLRARLRDIEPSCIVHSGDACIPNTIDVSFPGRPGDALVHRLDLEGVAVSHGSACSTGSLEPSPVLVAMGLSDELARSSVRISFGPDETLDDVDDFARRLARALRDVRPRDGKKFSRDVRFG